MKYEFKIPGEFAEHSDKVLVRLSYLHPELSFEKDPIGIKVNSDNSLTEDEIQQLKQNIYHQFYRERIFQETLPIRRWLYSND